MAWTRVQGAAKTSPSLNTLAFTATTTLNNRIIAAVVGSDPGVLCTAVADSQGNTYTKDISTGILNSTGSNVADFSIWSAPVTTAGIPTFTFTFSGGPSGAGAAVGEYSGLSTAAAAMDVNVARASSTPPITSGATAATTAANELVLGAYGDDGRGVGLAAGTGFSLAASVGSSSAANVLLEDADSGASGTTQTATASGADRWVMACVVYKLAFVAKTGTDTAAVSESTATFVTLAAADTTTNTGAPSVTSSGDILKTATDTAGGTEAAYPIVAKAAADTGAGTDAALSGQIATAAGVAFQLTGFQNNAFQTTASVPQVTAPTDTATVTDAAQAVNLSVTPKAGTEAARVSDAASVTVTTVIVTTGTDTASVADTTSLVTFSKPQPTPPFARVEIHDRQTQALVDILEQATAISYEKTQNKASIASFQLPRDDPKWASVSAFAEVWIYDEANTLIDVFRVMPTREQRSADGLRATVSCEGYATVLQDDIVPQEVIYENQSVGNIVADLLAYQTTVRVQPGVIDGTLAPLIITMRVSYDNLMKALWEVRNLTGGYISVDPDPTNPQIRQLNLRSYLGSSALALPQLDTRASPAAGTLATGTYYYRVSAWRGLGQGIPGPELGFSIAGPGGVTISWAAVPGATSYGVYGRTSGAELGLASVAGTSYTDTGAAAPVGAMPTVDASAVVGAGRDIGQRITTGWNLREIGKTTDPTQAVTKMYPLGRGEGVNQVRPSTGLLIRQQVNFELGTASTPSTLTIMGRYLRYKDWSGQGDPLPTGASSTDQRVRPMLVTRYASLGNMVDDSAAWVQGADERTIQSVSNEYNPSAYGYSTGGRDYFSGYAIDYVAADYIVADDTVQDYGVISRPFTDKAVEDSAALLAAAQAAMDGSKHPIISYTVRVADIARNYPGDAFERLQLFDVVNVYDPALQVTTKDRIVAVRYGDMADPTTFEITVTNAAGIAEQANLQDRVRGYETMADGASNIWTDGFGGNFDNAHPLTRGIYIPEDAVTVNAVSLNWRCKPYRYDSTVATIASASALIGGASPADSNSNFTQMTVDATPPTAVTNWQHTHQIGHSHPDAGHNHSLTTTAAIVEAGQPTAVQLEVDPTGGALTPAPAVLFSASVTSGSNLDLTPFLAKDSSGRIGRGWHYLKFTPNAPGSLEAEVITRVYLQSRGVVSG